ncbi:hypothetical protein OAT67_09770, partial [Bacteriovoracaceae bacterium]|nr:hypothetical protein [Bacteriovoracaceae bacterium]
KVKAVLVLILLMVSYDSFSNCVSNTTSHYSDIEKEQFQSIHELVRKKYIFSSNKKKCSYSVRIHKYLLQTGHHFGFVLRLDKSLLRQVVKYASSIKKLKAELFVAYYKQSKEERARLDFSNFYNIEAGNIHKVLVRFNRPKYGSEKARFEEGGPFFHLNEVMIFGTDGELWAHGYTTISHFLENSHKPSRKNTVWASYSVGIERDPFVYPNYYSYFLSKNRSPLEEWLSPEVNLKEDVGHTGVAYSGHDLIILRHKGFEYITLEGRPCVASREQDVYHCELPLTSKEN